MNVAFASAAGLGIALHQFFRRFEPGSILSAVASVAGANYALYVALGRLKLLDAAGIISKSNALPGIGLTSVASLLLSIAVYRLSPWHPLAKYPGEFIFKITKIRTAYASGRGDYFKRVRDMHAKYGPVVRVAPNAVSIVDAAAVPLVLGGNGLPKDRYYRARVPSLIMMNGTQHAQRRKLWNRGLGNEALSTHSQTAAAGIEKLLAQLDKVAESGQTTDMTMWMRLYGFDFMGYFAFGKDFGLVQKGADTGAVSAVLNSVFVADIASHLHWLGFRAAFIPGLVNKLIRLRRFAAKLVEERLQRQATTLDLWYYLGKEDEDSKNALTKREMSLEAVLAIIAGSDTTATAMGAALYLLISNPECLAKARAEIDGLVASGQIPWTNIDSHNALPYLSACLNETLRLIPVVPTNGSRAVPIGSGGRYIAGHYIPEETEVFVSPYLLHHDPRYFSPHTEEFRPERWIEPGWNTQQDAFIPFSAGPSQCVGKNLAKMEFTMVVAAIIRHYDLAFAPGWDPKTWPDHVEEHLVLEIPSLPVVLKRRAL